MEQQALSGRRKDGLDYLEEGVENMSRSLSFFFGFLGDAFKSLWETIVDFYYWFRGEEI